MTDPLEVRRSTRSIASRISGRLGSKSELSKRLAEPMTRPRHERGILQDQLADAGRSAPRAVPEIEDPVGTQRHRVTTDVVSLR